MSNALVVKYAREEHTCLHRKTRVHQMSAGRAAIFEKRLLQLVIV